MKIPIRCLLIALILSSTPGTVWGQTAPIGRAESADVLRPGHLGRQTGDLEACRELYRALGQFRISAWATVGRHLGT